MLTQCGQVDREPLDAQLAPGGTNLMRSDGRRPSRVVPWHALTAAPPFCQDVVGSDLVVAIRLRPQKSGRGHLSRR